jgi:hypothetical protein
MREKDQADFDLEKFVDLFDTAMSSDNPAVQRALRNLLMIAAMVDSENPAGSAGPLRRLVEDIKHLNNRLNTLEAAQRQPYNTTPTPYSPGSIPAVGTWPYTGPYPYTTTGTGTGTFPPNTIIGGGSATTGYVAVNSGAVSGDISAKYTSTTDKTSYYNAMLDTLEAKGPLA